MLYTYRHQIYFLYISMKKVLLILAVLAAGMGLWSCSGHDDHHETVISFSQLPAQAQTFVNTYFKDTKVTRVDKDTEHQSAEFEVYLADGSQIEFDHQGAWVEVTAPRGKAIPDGIAPEGLVKAVEARFAGQAIHEISIEAFGYEVELLNGTDIKLDMNFNITGVDR